MSITMNKASGSDGITLELFQILKYDAVKVLHSICQQIWKTQQWPSPLQYSWLQRSQGRGSCSVGRGSWQATVQGAANSQT